MVLTAMTAQAQGFLKYQQDTIPFFRGMAVSFDLVGAAQLMLSDHGQYEAALRVNLHDQYFPIVELGMGDARHNDDAVTGICYSARAPYFRIGGDVNIMNKKHTGNRVFFGIRYGFTNYKATITRPGLKDPVWQWDVDYNISGESRSQHWGEVIFGLDARIFGPVHIGWTGRYRFRFSHNDGTMGKSWYVPGYGLQDSSTLGYGFYLAIDI
jgi:hypothetical protein